MNHHILRVSHRGQPGHAPHLRTGRGFLALLPTLFPVILRLRREAGGAKRLRRKKRCCHCAQAIYPCKAGEAPFL